MKALVTGAGGFLGLYLVEQLLERGCEVRGFSRQQHAELAALGVESLQGDVRDVSAVNAACRGVDVVFHTASVAGIWGKWRDYYGINTLGTRNVVAACQRCNVPKLVYTSSPSVTFTADDQRGIDESAPYAQRWLCHYQHSKALAEQHVLQASGKNGLSTCALRPHLIWGPRDRHLIPTLLRRARSGLLRQVGDGANRIDIVYVENAAVAHVQAAEALHAGSPVAGSAYFISQGEPVNCWQWLNDVLALADLPPVDRRVSYRAAWTIGLVCEAAHRLLRLRGEPRMTRFLAAQLSKDHYFDISRARRDFGYEPRISTAEGMRRLGESLNQSSVSEEGVRVQEVSVSSPAFSRGD